METQSRIFKVVVAFQEKDEVFYTRIKCVNGVPASLFTIVCGRYPSLATLIKRCYVNDKSGAEFSIINSDDLGVFLEAEELFENVVRVEINGVNRDTSGHVVAPVDTAPKRVRIEEAQASPSPSTKPAHSVPKETHSGVVCDCCDETIVGFRYKCTECFNYDLCMTCEGKMRHCEHIMLRIPSPVSTILPRVSHKDAKRFAKKHPETAGMGCGEQERSRHHHGKRHQRRCHRGANLFDGFFRQMTEDSPASDVEQGTATNQGETASTGAQQEQQQQQQQAPRTNQPPMTPMYDFHKLVKVVEAVAGNVSKLFDPHGMSLETYADYGVNIPPTATPTPSAAAGSAPTSTPVNVSMEAKEQSTTTAEAEKQKEATKPTEIPANMQTEQLIVPEETTLPFTTSSVPEPTIMDVVDDTSNQSYVIQPTTDTVPMCPPSPVNNSTASDDAEWLVISNEGMPEVSQPDQQDNKATQVSPRKESVASTSAQTTVAASTENSAQTQGYDELAKKLQMDIEEQLRINSSTSGTQTGSSVTGPIVYHPVPHINMSINKMVDMGFSNDGGCLTELMACCNGDIRRALDSLLYKK